jgi:GxxExxY protein
VKEVEDQLSYQAIGMAMECHSELGPGLDEIFYHELLAEKLSGAGVAHQSKPKGRLMHRGILADEFEADLLDRGELALELKVLWDGFAPEHLLQIICYMKFWQLRAGLLFDFGKERLAIQRVAFTPASICFDVARWIRSAPPWIAGDARLDVVGKALDIILKEHGLGYRGTTYRGLLFAELTANGVSIQRDPLVPVRSAGGTLMGESRSHCFSVDHKCGLLITALRDTRQAADRAVLQTYLRHLDLPWGITVNFGKHGLDTRFVFPGKSRR